MAKKHEHKKKPQEHEEVKQENQEIDIEALQKQNEELQKKLEECLRAYAKCENDKKILKKETDAMVDYAYEKFAKDLLPVVDSLELAIAHANELENKEEAFDKLVEGVELTLKKMLDTFKNHGIEPVEHEEFNPEYHQAIQHVQSDEHEEGDIVDVYQKGYTLKGKLIRPSMVTINKK
ncbi:nucleotide exchange factor GrpE [Caminibacter pacificus]|jgi:molecular chaperone GrpE|uniref:Protein GrpE n=1 Tax=Caminibacter pacificus TaxID=1424653 RepID=A0AAJ4UYG9_9BACT|nr:nucleotide exchange factor GrpE [Caminibacter pacificus]NPA87963.1 nucleotide exchange factor GrpE [Campylobacterota bacterium]QCI28544.1 nucleotide exchange factor GrpE [Caminibacter pacificus]ROR40729.1 molecular chaperone GrpE [Caminibacter pacificus]